MYKNEKKFEINILLITIVNTNLLGRIIIYCATHPSCEYIYNKLRENLIDISIDYFHGGLRDNERETTMNKWKTNSTQIMVATSAFGMGINSNNIRVVIHVGAPISMTNLIQEAGRAGRDGNMATHYIFFSKKDIRINYSIVAEYRETLVLNYILHVHNKYNYKILIVVYYFFSASIVTNIE